MEQRETFYGRWLKIPLRVLGILTLIVACLAGFYLLSLTGPNRGLFGGSKERSNAGPNKELAVRLMQQSQDAEQKFNDAVLFRRPTDQDIKFLEEAMELQQQAIDALGGYDSNGRQRYEHLDELYQNHKSMELLERSTEAEQAANTLETREAFDKALEQFRTALKLQKNINEQYPKSRAYDVRRLAELERRVQALVAKPRYDKSIEKERLADEAIENEEWKLAKQYLTDALEIQKELNLEFRNIVYADVKRATDLDSKLVSLESSDLARKIEEHTKIARSLQDNDRHTDAAGHFQIALRLQRQLNEEFERSYFASEQEALDLKADMDNARSFGTGREIMTEIERMDGLLRRRQVWQALENIQDLARKASIFANSYPNHDLVTPMVVEKVNYLAGLRNDIGFYQSRIYSQLHPVPGHKGTYMLKTEVPQALFTNLYFSNPSREQGETNPVDSVTWMEANGLAQRVSWILGWPVRLPKREEFEAAVGSLRYLKLQDICWLAENSSERTHPVGTKKENPNGFYDLLGNVGEWLEPSGLLEESQTYVAGGNARDSMDTLADVPVTLSNRRSRDMMIGFRIVVEINPEDFQDITTVAQESDQKPK